MIEIELNKLVGTHTAPVRVERDGKVFYQQRRVGRKDTISNEDEYNNATQDVKSWIKDNPNRKEDITNTRDYCKAEYKNINKILRSIPNDVFSDFSVPEDIQSISNFLRDAPKFGGVCYRGTTISNKDDFDKFMTGVKSGNIQMKPFMSTTINQNLSKGFASRRPGINPSIYMEIKSKTGVSVCEISQFSKENEVLFDYGSNFKVINYNINDNEVNITLEEI